MLKGYVFKDLGVKTHLRSTSIGREHEESKHGGVHI